MHVWNTTVGNYTNQLENPEVLDNKLKLHCIRSVSIHNIDKDNDWKLYSADLMVFAFSALILAGYGNQGIMGNLTLRMYAMALLSNAADFTNLQNNYL